MIMKFFCIDVGDILWVDAWPLAGLTNSRNVLSSAFADSWQAPLGVDANGQVIRILLVKGI